LFLFCTSHDRLEINRDKFYFFINGGSRQVDGQEQHRRTGQKRKHPVRKTILIILGILIVGVLAYGTWFFVSAKSAIDSTYKSAGETKKAKTVVSEQKPLNVLLMGTD